MMVMMMMMMMVFPGRSILREVYEMDSEFLKLFDSFDFFVEFRFVR